MDILRKFFKWHEKNIDWWMNQLDINYYGVMWIAFFEGLILGLLLMWLF